MAQDADASRPRAAERERRLEKLAELTRAGPAVYPYRYPTDHSVADIRAASGGLGPDIRTRERVRIAGRVELVRPQGWLSFALLRDRTGAIQLYADRTELD